MLGRQHPLVKRLRDLRRDRALRDREGVLVAEGIHLVAEALAAGAPIEAAVAAPRLGEGGEGRALLDALARAGVAVEQAAEAVLDAVQDARSPQPVVAVVRRRALTLDDVVDGRPGSTLLVVAAGLQDPGNLGSLLRSADGAGATGFLATGGGADLFHPRTVRASAGSVFRLPAAHADLESALAALRRRGIATVGAAPRAEISYDALDWTQPSALVLGAEGAGLEEAVLATLDARIAVPMHPGVESLSVAAAGAVILFRAAQARRDAARG